MTYGAKTPTNQLLGERIRYYHDDNNICRYMEDGVTSGHISREKAKENMIYWDEESPKLTMTRKMAIEISKQSDHSLLECLCAVLTALRMIETLLCSGYVINIIKYGRFMARKIKQPSNASPYNAKKYRIAFLEWPKNQHKK